MSAKSKKQAKKVNDSSVSSAVLAKRNEDFSQNLADASNNYLQGLEEIQEEWLSFTNNLLQSNLEYSRDIFSCQDFNEVMQVQQAWLDKVNKDYQTELAQRWSRISDMAKAA